MGAKTVFVEYYYTVFLNDEWNEMSHYSELVDCLTLFRIQCRRYPQVSRALIEQTTIGGDVDWKVLLTHIGSDLGGC